jgi:acyl CoA:acetate/3-ketoacid CoA transferase
MAVKMCCYFKNADLLQKIIENYSNFTEDMMNTMSEEEIEKFEVKEGVLNYDYLEGKRKLDVP